jgi:predicted AlkP superfamily phosphohydrolase/phosphomutase
VRYHLPREEQWYLIADFLLREDKPDLLAVVFDGVDKIQHQAWPYIDADLYSSDPSPEGLRMRELCLEYFRRLDGYIEKLVGAAGPDVQVFLASDHGFTASTEVVRINAWLAEMGYLFWKEDIASNMDASWVAALDWSRTLAYCGTPSSNGITIRLAKDADSPGVPVHEYDEFRRKLIDDLYALCNESGQQVVTRVFVREEAFPGAAMLSAPDLTLELRDHGFVSIRNVTPVVEARETPAGTHHPEGIFIAAGKGIKPLGMVAARSIVDVAPSLLASLGLPIPQDLDGHVPEDWFDDGWLATNPIRIGSQTLPVRDGTVVSGDMEADDQAALLDQLRLLGYLE